MKANVDKMLAECEAVQEDLRSISDAAMYGEFLRRRRAYMKGADKKSKVSEQKLLEHLIGLQFCSSDSEFQSLW